MKNIYEVSVYHQPLNTLETNVKKKKKNPQPSFSGHSVNLLLGTGPLVIAMDSSLDTNMEALLKLEGLHIQKLADSQKQFTDALSTVVSGQGGCKALP